MDPQLTTIHYSDPLWITMAFFCGLIVSKVKLPPMVGFLAAGFILNIIGVKGGDFINAMADLGITLLLFTIGLKLKLRSLSKPEVYGVASIHIVLVTVVTAGIILALSLTSLPLIGNLNLSTALLIGFALSFSSTVFAVKILDELGATGSRHGKTAIGVLIIQDIAAVAFIAISIGKPPSPLALALLSLIPLRHLLYKVLDRVGHGELLILFGIMLALVGADLFELVGIKGDVGALIFGMLLANHVKANELAKTLLGFKELFLVGFFLSVGMTALPGWIEIIIALLLMLLLPIKMMIYFALFNLFNLRTSTSWRATFNLANYSEFGLIVSAIAVSAGWLTQEWLAVFALMISISFIFSSQFVHIRDSLYQKWRPSLKPFERPKRLSGEENLELEHIKVIVFGMGRMGTAAYSAMASDYHDHLVGVEMETDKARRLETQGIKVVVGDATNPDFWTRAPGLINGLDWVLLTLPTHKANIDAVLLLKQLGYDGRIAAISKFHDEEEDLKSLGVDYTFNIYTEAGIGFANELKKFVGNNAKST